MSGKVKVFLLIALVGAAAATSVFDEYLKKYNKHYEGAEYQLRQKTFQDNVREIAKHRAGALRNGEQPWQGVNEFTDMTRAEFLESGRVMKTKLSADARSCLANGVTADYSRLNYDALPTSYDWRTKGVVNPIQNQGQCGSCWTFSTIAAIESALAIKSGKLTKLSEQEIVDCSHGCVLEDGQQVCNQGCNGGWMWSALTDIISWKGEELETVYPTPPRLALARRPWPTPLTPSPTTLASLARRRPTRPTWLLSWLPTAPCPLPWMPASCSRTAAASSTRPLESARPPRSTTPSSLSATVLRAPSLSGLSATRGVLPGASRATSASSAARVLAV